MTQTRTYWMNEDYVAFMTVLPFTSPSSKPLMFDLRSNVTINKTWHANCKKPNVSKILDWLVK